MLLSDNGVPRPEAVWKVGVAWRRLAFTSSPALENLRLWYCSFGVNSLAGVNTLAP
jgi:hypothetical protein